MKKSVVKRVLLVIVLILVVLTLGGFIAFKFFRSQTLTFLMSTMPGNAKKYNAENVEVDEESPLRGKKIIFLGSSVTQGFGGCGTSFVDYLEQKDGVVAVKEAVGGTTLATIDEESYIPRMEKLDKNIPVDAFVCQLSTNDASKEIPLGTVSAERDMDSFDVTTVVGAMEYIICYAQETWNCPILFYTNTQYDSEAYAQMVAVLPKLEEKWGISVIDLWNDENLNNVSASDKKLYMIDKIHPTKAGYSIWWLPSIEQGIETAIG